MKSLSVSRLLSLATAISSAASQPLVSESVPDHLDSTISSIVSTAEATSGALVPKTQPKLPWREPSKDSHRCGGYIGYVEILCGTRRFCQAYDEYPQITDNKYANSKECFAAHENPSTWVPLKIESKLPWLPNNRTRRNWCEKYKEEFSGTWNFCIAFDTRNIVYSYQEFANLEDCFAAHEPNPRKEKFPWYEEPPKELFFHCNYLGYQNRTCGTERYGEQFDRKYERPDAYGPYKNSEECFADHEPGFSPASSGKKIMFLDFDPDDPEISFEHCEEVVELLMCGTKLYCEAIDCGMLTDHKYPTTKDCFDAFEPPETE